MGSFDCERDKFIYSLLAVQRVQQKNDGFLWNLCDGSIYLPKHYQTMRKTLILALFGYVSIGCSHNPQSPASYSDASAPETVSKMAAPQAGAADAAVAPPEPKESRVPTGRAPQKIIRNADVRFRVSDYATAGQYVSRQVKALGGMVMASSEQKTDNAIENALVIRVPAAQFDTLLQVLLKGSIFTDTKNITAEDVTEEFVDAEARLKSKKAVEQRYLDLLKQARSVPEIVQVEEQLRILREEIEAKEGRLKYLNDQVSYSTIRLTYYQATEWPSTPQEALWLRVWHNLQEGSSALLDGLVAFFFLLPSVLVLYGAGWLLRRWWKSRRSA